MAAVRSPEYCWDQEQDQKECRGALIDVKDACGLNLEPYLDLLYNDPKGVVEKLRVYKSRMVQ